VKLCLNVTLEQVLRVTCQVHIDLLKKLDEMTVVDRNHTKDSYYKINYLHHELTNENQSLSLLMGHKT
jgi:hypothetical protein